MPPASELTEQQRQSLETEARAKITWGHDPQQTVDLLEKRGMARADARALVARLMAKASRESRIKGLAYVGGGVAMVAAGGFATLSSLKQGWYQVGPVVVAVAGVGVVAVGLGKVLAGGREDPDL